MLEIQSRKVISDLSLKMRCFFGKISDLWTGFVQVSSAEDVEKESTMAFHILNLVLLVSLALLSPDKITQLLIPSQPSCTIIDGFHELLGLLRKLAPF